MEWGWLAGPVAVVVVGIFGWVWRQSIQITRKADIAELAKLADEADVNERFHKLSNYIQRVDSQLLDHRLSSAKEYVSKADLREQLEGIKDTQAAMDTKLDRLSQQMGEVSALVKRSLT